jgi:hypothetical protein
MHSEGIGSVTSAAKTNPLTTVMSAIEKAHWRRTAVVSERLVGSKPRRGQSLHAMIERAYTSHSQSCSGVWTLIARSKTPALGMTASSRSISLASVASLVTPAIALE